MEEELHIKEKSMVQQTIDEHELLDVGAKIDIILQGIRYAVLFQDIDTLKKAIIDLHNCVMIMDEIVEGEFGDE